MARRQPSGHWKKRERPAAPGRAAPGWQSSARPAEPGMDSPRDSSTQVLLLAPEELLNIPFTLNACLLPFSKCRWDQLHLGKPVEQEEISLHVTYAHNLAYSRTF